jgi:light-regulated signal transduction histidine kinase (bacteriophytochrome)
MTSRDANKKLGTAVRKSGRRSREIEGQPGVASKTEPLQQQLAECMTDLASTQKELESFCYSVSHDLRAPLRCIDGFSHALLHEFGAKLEPPAREYLQRIVDSAKKMAKLIDELLALSRIQRTDLVTEELNLTDIASQIIAGLRKAEPERNVQFVAAKAIPVRADRALITSMLEKLLDNAWKFTSRESPAQIELSEITQESERVFVVRDNGVGFDSAYAGKLFKAFQRLHSVTDFPGVGMGLATARAVILRHRGRVWGESGTDKGARFYFTLGRVDEK